jgi:hypothetical protein
MTANVLMQSLRSKGITLRAVGDRIRYKPASAVTPGELAALRALKPQILTLLHREDAQPIPPVPTAPPATAVEPLKQANARRAAKKGWRPSYAYPFPDALPSLGPRQVGPFEPCEACGQGTWVRYGEAVLCLRCSQRAAGYAPEEAC